MADIALDLIEYLETLWTYKDKGVLCKTRNKRTLEQLNAQRDETIFHLQELDNKLVAVWRAKEWAMDIQKHTEDKAKAEARLAQWDKERACYEYLVDLIVEKLGEIAGKDMAPSIAEDIIKYKKTNSALMFGAEREELPW